VLLLDQQDIIENGLYVKIACLDLVGSLMRYEEEWAINNIFHKALCLLEVDA
jgi:hypothetical protein